MKKSIKKYCFNRISFCYDCFNYKDLDDSNLFLFHNDSNNLICKSRLRELKMPLSKGFTPHIFFCSDYSENMNYLKYFSICGICNMEFIDKKSNKFYFERITESLSTIDHWNNLAISTQTF